ncbi:MAG TPA: creatininase family protein [Candidatus Brocadiia bacterium]|nr:creatininase family protein [Candidatus Brocadiia bacterium]
MKYLLSQMTLKDVREQRFEVAVLPVGSCEPHNFHLPYGCDAITVERLCDKTCDEASKRGARVVLLPTIPFGVNTNTMEFPMVISVNPSTIGLLIRDIVRSVEHHGIRKMVIVNGHGGNDFIKPLLRELYGQTKVFLSEVHWWKISLELHSGILSAAGEHGDEMETSVALELFPEFVQFADADAGVTRRSRFEALNRGWASVTRPWHLATVNSGYGNPAQATREKGAILVNAAVDKIAQYLKELSDAEMDPWFPYEKPPQ